MLSYQSRDLLRTAKTAANLAHALMNKTKPGSLACKQPYLIPSYSARTLSSVCR